MKAKAGAEPQASTSSKLLTLSLKELRQRAGKTQVEVALAMGVSRSIVSKLEREAVLWELRRNIAALGGELEVTVVFKNGKRFAIK